MLNFLSGEGICISAGSACSARSAGVSRALTAFGLPDSEADCSVRVSLSHMNTNEDIETFARVLSEGVLRLAKIR
jgi:cysteine desulfurase